LLLSPLAVCAGCWETIEYTGPRTSGAAARKPDKPSTPLVNPVAEASSPETSRVAVSPVSTAANTATPAEDDSTAAHAETALPESRSSSPEAPAAVEAAVQPKDSDDRYGLAKAEPSESSPPVDERPASAPSTEAPPDGAPRVEISAAHPPAGTTTVSTNVQTGEEPASASTGTRPGTVFDPRRAAWHLGSRLSLAVLANDRRLAAKNVPIWYEDAQAAAKLLGTSVSELPEPASADDQSLISQQAFDYLVPKAKPIGRELAQRYGDEEAALFEIAVKSNILLLMYTPDAQAGSLVSAAIAQASPKAKLPDALWKPLVEALNSQAPQADVRAAVRKMHVDVDRYLSERAEQKAP